MGPFFDDGRPVFVGDARDDDEGEGQGDWRGIQVIWRRKGGGRWADSESQAEGNEEEIGPGRNGASSSAWCCCGELYSVELGVGWGGRLLG